MGDLNPVRGRSLSPLWTPEGVFTYPPRSFWGPVAASEVSRAWAGRPGGAAGLYLHFPPEVDRIGEFFRDGTTHPFVECLRREAVSLALPDDLRTETVYLGGGGAGALSKIEPEGIAELLSWVRGRFAPAGAARQITAEVDPAGLGPATAEALADGGVDRAALRFSLGRRGPGREAFAAAVGRLRAAGIGVLHFDLAAGPGGRETARAGLDWALGLGPDSAVICDYGGLDAGAAAALAECAAAAFPAGARAPGNEQLSDAGRLGASILGLGWGALSRVRERLAYAAAGSCFHYAQALLNGRTPEYHGHAMDADAERRGFLIRSLEDTGRIDAAAFARLFGGPPEGVFPDEFAACLREGLLVREEGRAPLSPDEARHGGASAPPGRAPLSPDEARHGGPGASITPMEPGTPGLRPVRASAPPGFRAAGTDPEARRAASVRFYGDGLLRRLSGATG